MRYFSSPPAGNLTDKIACPICLTDPCTHISNVNPALQRPIEPS
jgi:hypothetical protein